MTKIPCPNCHGEGTTQVRRIKGDEVDYIPAPCGFCGGDAFVVYEDDCQRHDYCTCTACVDMENMPEELAYEDVMSMDEFLKL